MNETRADASSPTRSAVGFRKLSGMGAGAFSAGGAAEKVDASAKAASAIGSSRCGFPHRWQKRASAGNCAPQVQNSGMWVNEDLFNQFDAGSPTDASAI